MVLVLDVSSSHLDGGCVAGNNGQAAPDLEQAAAIELVLFLSSAEEQKQRAIKQTSLPTRMAIYEDPEVAAAAPIIPLWKDVFLNAVPRPSAPTKVKYNEVSSMFWSAVHDTLSGNGSAAENLELLEAKLTELKGAGW